MLGVTGLGDVSVEGWWSFVTLACLQSRHNYSSLGNIYSYRIENNLHEIESCLDAFFTDYPSAHPPHRSSERRPFSVP